MSNYLWKLKITPKHVSIKDIQDILRLIENLQYYKQMKALILLGAYSGMRPGEIYQLSVEYIKLIDRTVHINHNPKNGQTTKIKKSRISFFNKRTQEALSDYLTYFENGGNLKRLFSKSHIKKVLNSAVIQVQELRKYFSQKWDRIGGLTSIKKILMGHSLKVDVDLMHYNYQSVVDIKDI